MDSTDVVASRAAEQPDTVTVDEVRAALARPDLTAGERRQLTQLLRDSEPDGIQRVWVLGESVPRDIATGRPAPTRPTRANFAVCCRAVSRVLHRPRPPAAAAGVARESHRGRPGHRRVATSRDGPDDDPDDADPPDLADGAPPSAASGPGARPSGARVQS